MEAVSGGQSSTLALKGSTEEEQFQAAVHGVTPPAEVVAAADAEILTPDALAFVELLQRELGPRRRELLAARGARASASSTRARARTSCPRRGTSARATGRSRRPRPTCRTAGSRSPARSTAR